jgi:DNA-binding protein HU-beta
MSPLAHREITKKLSEQTGVAQRQIEHILDRYTDMIVESLAKGRNVSIKDIGTILVLDTPAKKGRDLNTNEPIDIPPSKRVKLRPCVSLKQAVLKGIM